MSSCALLVMDPTTMIIGVGALFLLNLISLVINFRR